MFDPSLPIETNCFGIFPSDIVIRSALLEAIRDLRAKPWLLRYCFAYLTLDPITKEYYGEAEIKRAIDWFMQHEIPVFLNLRTDDVKLPAISIKLAGSVEAEDTLADIHAFPVEDSDIDWPNLAGPFNATEYDFDTGIVTIPDDAAISIVLSPGQLLIDSNGGEHQILEVLDFTRIKIAAELTVDLNKSYIRGQRPAYQTALESKVFKETYNIVCYAPAEATHGNYLYMIVLFILLTYKQSLLEARNLERTSISASDFAQNQLFGEELVYSRQITLTGYVRQMWPKNISPKYTAISTGIRIAGSDHLFPEPESERQLWIGELDAMGNGSLPEE